LKRSREKQEDWGCFGMNYERLYYEGGEKNEIRNFVLEK